jgi:hypothetical protein
VQHGRKLAHSPPSPPLLVSMPRNVPECLRGEATSGGNSSAATLRGAPRGLHLVFTSKRPDWKEVVALG